MTKVMRPTGKDAVSVRHIEQTREERKQQLKNFKDRKANEQRLKEERFERMAKERSKKPRPGSGSGGGINIEVTGD